VADMTLQRQQMMVAGQIAVSVPLQIGFVSFAPRVLGLPGPDSLDLAGRLAFAFQWQVFGGLVLLAMIGFIAGARPMAADVIDGNDRAERLAVQVRIQRNTLEQLVIMVLAHVALATLLPPEQLPLIPTLVLLFVIARIFYWIGYSIHPAFRTLGFVATFYPNIGALGYAAFLLLR
jgi:magnesium-transporting ATPase (P-type)